MAVPILGTSEDAGRWVAGCSTGTSLGGLLSFLSPQHGSHRLCTEQAESAREEASLAPVPMCLLGSICSLTA